jgi:hypothetical protein
MTIVMFRRVLPVFLFLPALAAFGQVRRPAADSLQAIESLVPVRPEDCTRQRSEQLAKAADSLEAWAADLSLGATPSRDPTAQLGQGLDRLRRLAAAQRRVDKSLDRILALRTRFVELPESEDRREMLCRYLEITSQAINLSGRMRYLMRDGLARASQDAASRPELILDVVLENKSDVGALVMTYLLFDPPPQSGIPTPSPTLRKKVLDVMAASRKAAFLGDLSEFVRQSNSPPELVIHAAGIIREIGLPQDPDPSQGEVPPPEITAKELYAILASLDSARLSSEAKKQRDVLLEWLGQRSRSGISGDRFRINGFDIQPGDWLLMRNPSPYNLFTDLSPGLFTHVGVVTTVEDQYGVRRFVIVEMPEHQSHIPATNVEAYLKRTLHYFFLRHEDPKVGLAMSETARSVIGNETQFDLTFDNRHVAALKGQNLQGKRIHTYCAGFLLMCAQATTAPREEFFPMAERPAGGHCLENFAKLRLSLGEDFVSPTGCIFSPRLQLVGRREPFYEPTREIKEAIYDDFARLMRERQLQPSPTIFQALRQTLAGMSKDRPWLAQMLADANNVSQYTDLDAAARAAAVVETLDRIADSSAADFVEARDALMAPPAEQLRRNGLKADELAKVEKYRARHASLYSQWTALRLTPREMRISLVDYYTAQGRQQLEARFFPK